MRTRRKRTTKSIDSKIEAAKTKLERAKTRYEKAVKDLETLMNERDEIILLTFLKEKYILCLHEYCNFNGPERIPECS